jgi:hypothetical protein
LQEAFGRVTARLLEQDEDTHGACDLCGADDAFLRSRRGNIAKDDPDEYCQPLGVVRMNVCSNPRKIVQVPGLLVILYERAPELLANLQRLPAPEFCSLLSDIHFETRQQDA